MTSDPRAALENLVAALQEHLAASAERRGDQDPRVEAAYIAVADTYEAYEAALYAAYDEVTPFELYDDVEDAREDDDVDDVDEDDLDLYGEEEDDHGITIDTNP
ncbi:hypothetical protein LWF01_07800 [Saxibacter everestensis]|uniref:Primosomal protein n=1 Tax=Saxibacter everestensis TaxID=2909229 RepID=A0ABY8QYX3_9MICO|nr:hypothetical protein LWF01_07800 [Brevibacteriaceae bacterium ZFBP1038]